MILKRINSALILAWCCFLPSAFAQDIGPLKVGYVDFQTVAMKSPQMEEAKKRLEKEFNARKEELKGMEAAYLQLRERLQKEGLTMSNEDLRKLEENILAQERKIRWNQSIMDEDFKIRRNQVMTQLQQDIVKTITTIAQQEKYDLILTDGVLMSSSRINLTDRILTELKNNMTKKK
ncbi:MAG TPA: OmpH family outer membrane protein [Gammaproteobacteria bacterium]